MNTTKNLVLCLCISMFTLVGNAQKVGKLVNENYEKNWSFGAGFNVVDDSGDVVGGISNVSENWMFSTPFYISAEYYLNNEFSFMAMFSTNKYTSGKNFDKGYIIEGEDASYFSADLDAKFSFREIMQSYKFDPYVFIGLGYNSIGETKTIPKEYGDEIIEKAATQKATFNMGLGFNYWFSQTWGLNLNLAAKVNLSGNDGNRTNHKQYSLGVVYFLN